MRLLGEDGIAGALRAEAAQDQLIGPDIARVAQGRREIMAHLLADRQQQPPCLLRQICGQFGVGATHPASITEPAGRRPRDPAPDGG